MGVLTKIKETMSLVSKKVSSSSIKKVGVAEYEILEKILAEKKDSYIRIESRLMFYTQLQKELDINKEDKESVDMISEDVNLLDTVKATLDAEICKIDKKLALLKKMGYAKEEKVKNPREGCNE